MTDKQCRFLGGAMKVMVEPPTPEQLLHSLQLVFPQVLFILTMTPGGDFPAPVQILLSRIIFSFPIRALWRSFLILEKVKVNLWSRRSRGDVIGFVRQPCDDNACLGSVERGEEGDAGREPRREDNEFTRREKCMLGRGQQVDLLCPSRHLCVILYPWLPARWTCLLYVHWL